jgi:hypothetical protein
MYQPTIGEDSLTLHPHGLGPEFRMNIQLLGIGSDLHSFAEDDRVERRQYPRLSLRFALWWLKDLRGSEPVPGLGIEISGGGLQFLLRKKTADECSLAFEIHGRRMRASVDVLHSAQTMFEGGPWHHHRAKFVGLIQADFDFLMRQVDGEAKALSAASHQSYEMLPQHIQEQIVAKLAGIKRLAPCADGTLPHLAAHYAGKEPAKDGDFFHRFFIRSHMQSPGGAFVYNTEVWVSDDGSSVRIR